MSYCLPVFRGVKQLLLCCCHYVSIIYSLKLYCFRLVPLIYDVMMWALNMQDWLYFFWAYWASWVWAGHEDTDTWHEDTNLCRTCDILTRSLVNIMAAFHIFIARFKSTNVGWARRMLRYNCSSPPRPAVVCCCCCGCAVVYLLNMQYIISAKHGVGHYSCLCLPLAGDKL